MDRSEESPDTFVENPDEVWTDDAPEHAITDEGSTIIDDDDARLPRLGNCFGPYEGVDRDRAQNLSQILSDLHVPDEEQVHRPGRADKYRFEGATSEEVLALLRQESPDSPEEYIARMIDGKRSTYRDFEGESSFTEAEVRRIGLVTDMFKRVGDEIGVDLAGRLPDLEYCHIFDDNEAYCDALRRIGCIAPGERVEGGGRLDPYGGLFVVRRRPGETLSTITHELAHDSSLSRVGLRTVNEGSRVVVDRLTRGYIPIHKRLNDGQRLGSTSTLEELAAEMLTNKAYDTSGTTLKRAAYGPICYLGSAIVRRTADYHSMPAYEVENLFLKGHADGDMTGLCLMTEAVGEEGMTRFAKAPANYRGAGEVAQIAHELGFPEVRRRIQMYCLRIGLISYANLVKTEIGPSNAQEALTASARRIETATPFHVDWRRPYHGLQGT